MKKMNMIILMEKCNWRRVGTLVVIAICLVSVMCPALTQSSFPLFNNANNTTDGEIPEPAPSPTTTPAPTLTPSPSPEPAPTPTPCPTPPPTPNATPSPAPSPSSIPSPASSPTPLITPTPSPSPPLTPTPGPTPTLTPAPSPAPTPTPTPIPAAPNITSFAPPPHVYDVEGASRTFNITTDQTVNVSWLLNGTRVQTNESVTEASYTNISPLDGIWNITALASNGNGTVSQMWLWNVSPQETPALTPSPTPCPTPGIITPSPSPKPTPKPTPKHSYALSSDTTLTPFYIFGFVRYENGDECLHPVVNIAINTTKLQAESSPDYNFFQFITTNISEGDIIRFNVTDGASYNTTIHEVNRTEINNGGIFNLTLTLPAPALRVDVELTPDDDPSTQGIQIINPDPNTNKTVTIIANITDLNDFGNITNITVTANISGPSVVEDSPVSLNFVSNVSATTAIYKGTFNISTHSAGEYKVEVIATDVEGTGIGIGSKNFSYLPLRPAAPRIVAYAPSSPVSDFEGSTRTFNITTDQTVNVSWLLNGTEVFNQTAVNESAYTNTSAAVGTWNVSAAVSNPNGTAMQTWIWTVSQRVTPTPSPSPSPSPSPPTPTPTNVTPSPPLYIFGSVYYKNGTTCNAPFVKITNLNTSKELIADTHFNSNFYQLITNSRLVNASNVLKIEASKDGTPVGNATYTVNQTDIERGTIIVDINPVAGEPDFTVMNITFNPEAPKLGDIVEINTTIVNLGFRNETTSVALYYDNRSSGEEVLITNKTVTLNINEPQIINASWRTGATYGGAGLHNITVRIDPGNVTTETNETNNILIEPIFVNGTDLAVTEIEIPCDAENPCYVKQAVNITATIANLGAINATNFSVYFQYETQGGNTSVFNITSISYLRAGNLRNITVPWKPLEIGSYNITVNVTFLPLVDNNETNNLKRKGISMPILPGLEFSIVNVSVYPEEAQEGENVTINATIRNDGEVSANVSVGFFVNYTDFAAGEERFVRIGTTEVYVVPEGGENITSFTWTVNVHGGDHLIAAVADPDNEFPEMVEDTFTPLNSPDIMLRGNESGNNVKGCTLNVITPDLTITDFRLKPEQPGIGDTINMTVEVKNNGNTTVNTTVWFYAKRDISEYNKTWRDSQYKLICPSWSLWQPENTSMRVHFDFINITTKRRRGVVKAYDESEEPVYFYVTEGKRANAQAIKAFNISADKSSATPGYSRLWNVTCELICDKTVTPWKCSWNWIWKDMYNFNSSVDLVRWQDIWTDWCNDKKLEISAIGDEYTASSCTQPIPGVEYLIDEYQFLLGKKNITLKPGETKLCNLSWNTSFPVEAKAAGKNYTFIAFVEGKKREREIHLGGTDLAVTNISLEPVEIIEDEIRVLDGNLVWLNATVKNFGYSNASKFNLSFYEVANPPSHCHPHYELLGNNITEALPAGDSINVSIPWNASIRDIQFDCWGEDEYKWNKSNCYYIMVKIDPLENPEEDYVNNNLSQRVYVKPSRDFYISNLSFVVNNETICPDSSGKIWLDLYDNVTLNATINITNYANQGGTVNVGFYLDGIDKKHEIGSTSVKFGHGYGNETIYTETGYANISWMAKVPGDHNITVVVNPEPANRRWKIYEINESNNTYKQLIHVRAPDLVVELLDVNPETIRQGENAFINVTIANRGALNASEFNVSIYDCAERHIEDVSSDEMYCGFPDIIVRRDDAIAMRLYLDLEIDGGSVCVYDSKGTEIECYYDNFHGWTPWIYDDYSVVNTTMNETNYAYAKVSRIYYLKRSEEIHTKPIPGLDVNETANFSVVWTPHTDGERFISAVVDPENDILEYDETNNESIRFVTVHAADLKASNLSLWLNDSSISDETEIKHGDNVTIKAEITNIGIKEVDTPFNVTFFVDDIPIEEEPVSNLTEGQSIHVSANWTAEVGNHVIKVESDYGDEIDETNETNNIAAVERYVCGAEVSGNETWETLGLHGEILFPDEPEQPYDEDTVNITVNITNIGCVNATNFNVLLFFDYSPESAQILNNQEVEFWRNKTYPGAEWVYLRIIDRANKYDEYWNWDPMDAGDVEVYDAEGNAILNESNFETCGWTQVKEGKSCWIPVRGDTANVKLRGGLYETFIVFFYPIYQNGTSWLYEGISVPINSSVNLTPPMQTERVRAGKSKVIAVIDPENHVPEDNKTDNIVSRIMHVNETRDFTVLNVTADNYDLSDIDTTNITAEVANVGLRNGTANVSITDYETGNRMYEYQFNKSLRWSYLPVPPKVNKSLLHVVENAKVPSWNLMIIHRPGADSIQLHFDWISLVVKDYLPAIVIQNGTGDKFVKTNTFYKKDYNISVPGDTVYIYNNSNAKFSLRGYTTKKELLYAEAVPLNATVGWYEPENFTVTWLATTGNHTINVTVWNHTIKEINETNNSFILPLNVSASRDPSIENITFNPEHPKEGDNVTITAIVKNNGTKKATFMVDLWLNLTRNSSIAPVPGADWVIEHEDENRTSYIMHLKRENVTLLPGKNGTVSAIWHNISIEGDATYKAIAIVDPLGEIDEINESRSDNDMRKEIKMDYPDLTVAKFVSPSREDRNASVVISNTGIKNATNVTVRFEVSKYKEITKTGSGVQIPQKVEAPEEGAKYIRVHFEWLDARENGWLEIRKNKTDKVPVKRYEDVNVSGWSPWVPGDSLWLVYSLKTYKEEGKSDRNFKIDAIEWGEIEDVLLVNKTIEAGESIKVRIPPQWGDPANYKQPQNLKVTVDPDNNITEQREDNNSRTGTMYIDLTWVKYKKKVGKEVKEGEIHFVSPDKDHLSVLAEHNNISAKLKNNNETEGIVFPVNDFYLTLEVRHPNGTLAFSNTTHYQDFSPGNKTLYAGEEEEINFTLGKIYPDFDGDTKDYTVTVIADSKNNIIEGNDFYPQGESDNNASRTATVYHVSGYTGGDLSEGPHGRVYGDVVYSIGNSTYDVGCVNFNDIKSEIPANANITLARLYYYWFYWDQHSTASSDMNFYGESISYDKTYYDDTVATKNPARWGTHVYNVAEELKEALAGGGDIVATATSVGGDVHPAGMLLLVVYEKDDPGENEPLIEYWIDEGAFALMADNKIYPSGLSLDQCTANAYFNGTVNKDSVREAKLLTVLPLWTPYEPANLTIGLTDGEGDALVFGQPVECPLTGARGGLTHWEYAGTGCMAFTGNKWEDVTNLLSGSGNSAKIQSKGNFMLATNAILKITYLPDLTVTSLAVTPSSPKGGDKCKIEATIRNDGEAKAENFKVKFTASDGTPKEDSKTIKLLDGLRGNNTKTVNFNWTAPKFEGGILAGPIQTKRVNISVVVDPENSVKELDESNNNASKEISMTLVKPPFRLSPGGGPGNGTGPGEGGEAEVKTGSITAGSGEAAIGASRGKTITGYLMKGRVTSGGASGGGGGGMGEFSWAGLLIRIAMLAVAIALVLTGYLHEKRQSRMK